MMETKKAEIINREATSFTERSGYQFGLLLP